MLVVNKPSFIPIGRQPGRDFFLADYTGETEITYVKISPLFPKYTAGSESIFENQYRIYFVIFSIRASCRILEKLRPIARALSLSHAGIDNVFLTDLLASLYGS